MPPSTTVVDALSTDHLQADLKARSVRGGAVTLTSQGAQFLLQSVSTVVLARLLTPADFGIVAMVTALTAVAGGFADLGLTEATIQRKVISHNQISTLFWINVAFGVLLMLLTAALAPLLAWFYREPRLIGITLLVSLTFLVGGLRAQHGALLKRQMRFSSLAIRDVTSLAVGVPVGIIMASYGAGYWAIVALPLTVNITQMVMSWFMVDWKPGWPRRDADVRSFLGFGGKVAASYVIYNWIRSADNILIGWYWGAGPLGLYSRAYNLLMLPVNQLGAPTANVAIPTFSRLQNDREVFARYYLRVANMLMWVGAPLFGFLFVAAKPIIVLTLGSKWVDAAPVFQILAVSAFAQLLLDSTLWLFVSRGQSDRLLKLLLIISPVIVGSFVAGLRFGIEGVALSLSLVLFAIIPWALKFAFVGTDLTLQRLGKALVCPISLCLAGVCVAECATHLIVVHRTPWQLPVAAIGFVIPYSLSALIRPMRDEIIALSRVLSELRVVTPKTEPAA